MTTIQGLRPVAAAELTAVHGGFSLGKFFKKVTSVVSGVIGGAKAGSRFGTVGSVVGGIIGGLGRLF